MWPLETCLICETKIIHQVAQLNVDDAVIEANERHQTQMMQYLNNQVTQAGFQRLVLEIVQAIRAQATEG